MSKNNFKRYAIPASYLLVYATAIAVFRLPAYVAFLCLIPLTGIIMFVYRSGFYAFAAVVNHRKGKIEESIALFEKSIRANRKNVKPLINYAIVLLREGNAIRAKEILDGAKNLPRDVMEDKNYTFTLGSCYWIMGDVDSAIRSLEDMRAKYEYINSEVLSTLGYLYFLKKDYDKAMEISDMAIADKESCAIAYDNKGQIYFAKNEFELAKENFELSLKYKETLVDSLYYLGLIYELEGNWEKCKELFDRAHNAKISSVNTVTKEEVENKYLEYTSL